MVAFNRDYGLGDITVTGPPSIKGKLEESCPRCKGVTLFQIEVPVKDARLKGGKGIGLYVGCAACGYASPLIARATP